MDAADCQPDFCLDLFDPTGNSKRETRQPPPYRSFNQTSLFTGHGRKRRAIDHDDKNATEFTKFKENLQYTVLMPGELSNEVRYRESGDQCRNFVMISGLLAGLLALSTIIVS